MRITGAMLVLVLVLAGCGGAADGVLTTPWISDGCPMLCKGACWGIPGHQPDCPETTVCSAAPGDESLQGLCKPDCRLNPINYCEPFGKTCQPDGRCG